LATATQIDLRESEPNPYRWLIALSVMLGTVLELLDTSIVNVALPHMQGTFSASVDEITWVATSYLIANGIMIPLTGWISSRFGRKKYFLFSVTTFVAASAMCGAAQSLQQIVIFRLLQGLAGAAMQPSSQAIMMETFPPREQTTAMAIWSFGMMVAPVMGPTVGGWITDNWSWRWCFYINVPVGFMAILMAQTFLEDPPYLRARRKDRIDGVGIACIVLALASMQLVADRGQRADWFESAWVVYATILSLVAGAIFVWRELHVEAPVLDLRILSNRVYTITTCFAMSMTFALWGVNLINPIFLQEYMGYSAWQAGLTLAPRALSAMASLMLVGQLSRIGVNTKPLIPLGVVGLILSLWMMSRWNAQVGPREILDALVVSGFSNGLIFAQLSAISMATVPAPEMGNAASMSGLMRNISSALGVSMLTSLLVERQQVHQARLVEHFSIFDAWRMSATGSRMPGAPTFHFAGQSFLTQRHGLAAVYSQVQAQAGILSFEDIYWVLAIWLALLLPAYLLIRKAATSRVIAAH
jgi:DHA2 family multidrug resistance protein